MRGFACIGLHRPKTPENIGGVLRAAHCYGVSQVNIAGARASDMDNPTNTPKTHRHTPVFIVDDVLSYTPCGAKVVAVEIAANAIPLPAFTHPERAIYIFGPEDGSLTAEQIERADHAVYIPTRNCMNLAATVNVVLYDRLFKRSA